MMNFLTLKPEAFGLDISDSDLKFAKLKKSGKFYSLASFGESKIESGIIQEGEVKDEEKLIKIIGESIKKARGEKLKTKYVVASLPEEKAYLQIIQMPRMSEEDLKSAVIYEAENYIPLPIDQVYLDFQIVKPFSDHLDHVDVLVAAFPKKLIDSYIFCLKGAGLTPLVLEVEAQAIARVLVEKEMSPSPLLLINFAKNRISFIIFSGFSIRFTSSIPVALPQLTDLVLQIKKYLSFYQTHASHEHLLAGAKAVEKIIICGEGENLKKLPDFLFKELKIAAELGNPWINILPESQKNPPNFSDKKSLSFAAALGLAKRAVNLKND